MKRPTVIGCPSELEYLTKIDQLTVQECKFRSDGLFAKTYNIKYEVQNALGQRVYKAKEDTHCCEHTYGPKRRFRIRIYDNAGQEVIQLRREHRCRTVCYILDAIKVESPPGVKIGYVKQRNGCKQHYEVMDETKTTVLQIAGSGWCNCYCPGNDIPFEILSASGDNEVGKITDVWSSGLQDKIGIKFPIDLDAKMKAVVLGAVFLIDINIHSRKSVLIRD